MSVRLRSGRNACGFSMMWPATLTTPKKETLHIGYWPRQLVRRILESSSLTTCQRWHRTVPRQWMHCGGCSAMCKSLWPYDPDHGGQLVSVTVNEWQGLCMNTRSCEIVRQTNALSSRTSCRNAWCDLLSLHSLSV